MIILREPIKLYTARSILAVSDVFNEKILANYMVMQASFMPEDLLHLLTGTGEQEEPPTSVTSIMMSNSKTENTKLQLDIINNVVNRILLSDRADFTYQDTIFVTSVLNKMGITDVSEFMKQVRQITEESRNILSLSNLYQDNFSFVIRLAGEIRKQREQKGEKAPEPELPHAEERYYLHNEIYNRLQTARIYSILSSLHFSQVDSGNVVNLNELRLSEYYRVSNLLRLSDYKQQVFDYDPLVLVNHVSSYESGDILPVPRSEREVVERAAAAVLISLIDNAAVSLIRRISGSENIWLDIRNAITAAAENTLYRFEAYHTGQVIQNVYSPQYKESLNIALGDEINELKKLAVYSSEYRGPVSTTDISMEYTREEFLLTHITNAYPQVAETVEHLEKLNLAEGYITVLEQSRLTDRLSREITERLRASEIRTLLEKSFTGISIEASPEEIVRSRESVLTEHIQTEILHPDAEQPAEPVAEAPTAEETAAVIRERLRQIDTKNREMFEKLSTVRQERLEKGTIAAPDRERIQKAALEAIEHPERIISEIAERKLEMQHIEQQTLPYDILQNADEYTRTILEMVERYRTDPSADIEAGIVRPAVTEELNSEIRKAIEERELEFTHRTEERLAETQVIRDTIESVTERIRDRILPETRESAYYERGGAHIVHRYYGTGEVYESSVIDERQRKESRVTSTESTTVTTENLTETQINKITQEVISKAGEDITEIVNRTLARQIGTISERVISRMEKKLQMERARRGRF